MGHGVTREDAMPQIYQAAQLTRRSARARENSHFALSSVFTAAPDFTGTVIALDAVYYEDPDFDPARFLNRFLLLIEFLGLPIVLLWYFMTYYGPLSFVLGILAIVFFFRIFSPLHLLAMLGIFQHLNPFRPARERSEQEPVQYFRMRERSGREMIVRRKGHFRDGNIMAGDEVSIWGYLRGGTLHFLKGVSLRTGASISLRSNRSWLFLLLNLVVAGFLVGLFYQPLHIIMSNLTRISHGIGGMR
ncbi:MAG: hypothetical protein ACREX3_23550 [Gammaproteobacteria bacterium]